MNFASDEAVPNLRSLDAWIQPGRFALLLATLIIVSFPEVIFGVETFVFRDFGLFGFPLAHYHRESFWNGEIPLWNPLNNLGLPFLAQWNTMTLYPLSLFYLLFPISWALGVFCLLHLFLGGLGMYYLAHRWTWCRLGAAVAGIAFAFNGLTLNSLMWPNNISALGWMPWVVLLVERGWKEGGRFLFIGALCGGMQMMTGAPEIILFTWLFLSALLGGQFILFAGQRSLYILRFVSVVLLVGGLAAAQLLPFLELLKWSHRSTSYSGGEWAMPWWGWANLIYPLFNCYKSSPGVYFQSSQYWTSSYYPGIIIVTLSFLAGKVVKKRVWLLIAVLIFSLILALGSNGGVYWVLQNLIPQIRFARFPIKFIVLAIFIFPVLAAYGVRSLIYPDENSLQPPPRRLLQSALWITGVLAVLLVAAYLFSYPTDDWVPRWVNPMVRASLLFLFVAIFLSLWQVARTRSQVLLKVALLMLLWLEVWTHAPSQNPTVRSEVYTPGLSQKGIEAKPKHGTSRVMLSRYAQEKLGTTFIADPYKFYLLQRQALSANCNLLDGIPKLNGLYSLYVTHSDIVISTFYDNTNQYSPQLLDFFGISHLTVPQKVFDWMPRTTFMPMATMGPQPEFLEDTNALKRLMSEDFNPRKSVILPWVARTEVRSLRDVEAQILSSNYLPHKISLEVSASQPALLVLSQTWYPHWRAFLGAKELKIWRANHGFQAVEVPPGKHRVEFVYQDKKFQTGAVVSLATLGFCLLGMILLRRSKPSQAVEPGG